MIDNTDLHPIDFICEWHVSLPDIYGNVYNFILFTDTHTNKTISGYISGGKSNIEWAFYNWAGNNDNKIYTTIIEIEHKIREFNHLKTRYDANKHYLGCTREEIRKSLTDLIFGLSK